MNNAQQITTGSRVRVQLPEWDGLGCIVYTVELIAGDEATVREPRIPGLTGETRNFPTSQLVAA